MRRPRRTGRRVPRGVAAALVAGALGCADAGPLAADDRRCPGKEGAVTEFGRIFTKKKVITSGREARLSHRQARYLRIKIELVRGGANPWTLFVRDPLDRVLQVLDADSFGDGRVRWTGRLPTWKVLFDLRAGPDTELRTLEYVAMPDDVPEERAYYSYRGDKPAWLDLHQGGVSQELRRLGDSVGFLTTSRGQVSWCCSGVVVQTEPVVLFLTNFHCGAPSATLRDPAFWTEEICARTFIDFSWDGDKVSHEFRCREVLDPDPKGTPEARARAASLDLALLRIEPADPSVMPLDAVELGELPDGATKPSLQVIHHPRCAQKQISKDCSLDERKRRGWRDSSGESDFSHHCDTEAGSSGAPVFDSRLRLVGLHHLGYELRADDTCDKLNKAVRIDQIRDFLDRAIADPVTP